MKKSPIENPIDQPNREAGALENEEANIILIEDSSSKSEARLFEFLERRILYLDKAEYEQRVGNSSLANFYGKLRQTDKGKVIENASVYINKDSFIVGGEDYSDLIPIVVRHEVAEFWTYAKTGYSMSPAPTAIGERRRSDFAHGLALRKEYEYAFELGIADRYLEFIIQIAPSEQIEENQKAYELAKQRHERKSK